MTTTDCSTNRFYSLKETQKENPFMIKNKSESNSKCISDRWSSLDSHDDLSPNSPKNTFKKRDNNFGPDRDRYGNYRKSAFKKETRPKTPPPLTFKLEENEFPPLG